MHVPLFVAIVWWILLAVTVFVVVPWAVYLLHRAFNAARQIERYAARSLEAGAGIAANTANVSALEQTIAAAGRIGVTSGAIEEHTGTIGSVLSQRAKGTRR